MSPYLWQRFRPGIPRTVEWFLTPSGGDTLPDDTPPGERPGSAAASTADYIPAPWKETELPPTLNWMPTVSNPYRLLLSARAPLCLMHSIRLRHFFAVPPAGAYGVRSQSSLNTLQIQRRLTPMSEHPVNKQSGSKRKQHTISKIQTEPFRAQNDL